MPYVRDSFWRGRQWASETAMQTAAVEWCRDVAGRRSHRALDGAAPLTVFTAVEAEELRPLPTARFELARWSTPKVGPDCHVKVGKALYSEVPPGVSADSPYHLVLRACVRLKY